MNSWMIKQTWEHLMFMHWDAEPETIKTLIPRELELDLFEGRAWVTILPWFTFEVQDGKSQTKSFTIYTQKGLEIFAFSKPFLLFLFLLYP